MLTHSRLRARKAPPTLHALFTRTVLLSHLLRQERCARLRAEQEASNLHDACAVLHREMQSERSKHHAFKQQLYALVGLPQAHRAA